MSESKTSQNRLGAADKQRQALELRKEGKTLETIAAKLGYGSASGAYRAVMSALQKTLQEPADELRKLELERLDVMMEASWWAASHGNPQAVDRVLKIMERRAKLLGLDAPATVNVNLIKQEAQRIADVLGVDAAEVIAEAERILASRV